MEQIIEELKSIREKFAITMLEISQGCGVTERSVIAWLNNNSKPHQQHLIKIEAFVKKTKAKVEADEKREIERCEAVILDEIYNGENCFFHARPRAGETWSEANYPTGISQRDVSLISLSKVCAMRLTDPIILKVLDHLAQRGQIKINLIFIPIRRNFEHITFKIEIAEAERSVPGQDRDFEVKRSYRDKPRTQQEIEASPGILNPKEQVEAIYEGHENSLKLRYGASGIEKEIELHREKIEDESRLRIAQLRAGNGENYKKRGETMEGDHAPASEFTELRTIKKVREFFEEKKTNATNVTQIYYDCNHNKVVIEPGETKIILKMRMLKKMPVEEVK